MNGSILRGLKINVVGACVGMSFLFGISGCGTSTVSNVTTLTDTWVGVKHLGATSVNPGSMTVDKFGNIYAVGTTTAGINGNTLTGVQDVFISQYSSSGALNWVKQLGATGATLRNNGSAVDSSGNVVIVGDTTRELSGNTQAGANDVFIAQYSTSGTLKWVKQLGAAPNSTLATGVAIDSLGNVYVTGTAQDALSGNTRTGSLDYFLAKYTNSGDLVWVKQTGVASVQSSSKAIAIDSSGNIYIGGFRSIDNSPNPPGRSYFLAQYASDGTQKWIQSAGNSAGGVLQINALTVDQSGKIDVAGTTNVGLNGNSLSGTVDLFVAQYSSDGTLSWLKQIGASNAASLTGIAADTSGNIYIGGYTVAGINGKAQIGITDGYIAQFSGTGTLNWLKQLGTAGKSTGVFSLIINSLNNIYVTVRDASDLLIQSYTSSGVLR